MYGGVLMKSGEQFVALPKDTGKVSSRPRKRTNFIFPSTVGRKTLIEGGSDRRLRQLLYDLTRLSTYIESMRARFAVKMNITPPQYNVLMFVAQHQQQIGVTVNTVAKHLHVSGAFVTMQVTQLVKKGLLHKRPNPGDRRSIFLMLTEKGEKAVKAIAPVLRRVNDQLFRSLSRRDFVRISLLVERMIGDAEEVLESLPYFLADSKG